jgi:3-methylcrotonyl-CoA carboxylase alpha subunit
MPAEDESLRIDTGFGQGSRVSQYYDPMLAKVIARAETREAALARLRSALSSIEIVGVSTNAAFLARLLAEEAVLKNAVDTGYIERERAGLGEGSKTVSPLHLGAACAAFLHSEAQNARRDAADPHSPWAAANAWTLSGSRKRQIEFRDGAGAVHGAALSQSREGLSLEIEGKSQRFAFAPAQGEKSRFTIRLGEISRTMTALIAKTGFTIFDGPEAIKLTLAEPFAAEAIGAGPEAGPVAPMPGTIMAFLAKPGEILDAGAPMLILEAMKMEHTLRFPARGRIARYLCAVGDFVAEGAVLAEFEAEEAV